VMIPAQHLNGEPMVHLISQRTRALIAGICMPLCFAAFGKRTISRGKEPEVCFEGSTEDPISDMVSSVRQVLGLTFPPRCVARHAAIVGSVIVLPRNGSASGFPRCKD
jgi:hypothetical protein